MRHKKGTTEAKVHGHIKNNFHTVEQPGFSTSFYISGEQIDTLAADLEKQGTPINRESMTPEQIKTALGTVARKWFKEMMEAKKNEFS